MDILGYTYRVDKDKTILQLGEKAGVCYTRDQKISLASDQPSDSLISTFIHEIIEALDYHLELKLKHSQLCAIEVGIFSTLQKAGVDFSPLLNQIEISEEKNEVEEGSIKF